MIQYKLSFSFVRFILKQQTYDMKRKKEQFSRRLINPEILRAINMISIYCQHGRYGKKIDQNQYKTKGELHSRFLMFQVLHLSNFINLYLQYQIQTFMGTQQSICSSSTRSALQTDACNTIEFDGERFVLPSTINFDKQATFLKIQSAAKSFCQLNRVNMFYYALVTRMIAYRHEKLFLAAWAKVKDETRQTFLEELNAIQHDLMDSFYHHYFQREKRKITMRKSLKNAKVNPPQQYHPQLSGKCTEEVVKLGKQLLKMNKVGVVFMLAGYSSRFDLQDKFLSPISLYEKVTILDLMFKRMKRNGLNAKSAMVTIICNEENMDRIRKYLQGKDYFGFAVQNIKLLASFVLPIFDKEGQYCYSNEVRLIKRSAGTANCAEQLFSSELFQLWRQRGVEYVYFSGGQNLLENPCDPTFLGRMFKEDKNAGIKCVKSQFFGQNMPRLFSPAADSLKIIQSTHFQHLPSGTLEKLPIGLNSLIFSLQTLQKVIKDYASNISLAANYQELKVEAEVFDFEKNQANMETCFNFQKDIRYLVTFIKDPLLYRVHRPDEFAPIMSKNKEYSFNQAIKYYRGKLEKELIELAG